MSAPLLLGIAAACQLVLAQAPHRVGTDHVGREVLATARANGSTVLPLTAVTRSPGPAATDSLVRAVTALGGRVQVRVDEIGYVRAVVPVDAVLIVGALPGVAEYDVGVVGSFDRIGSGDVHILRPDGTGRSTASMRVSGGTPPRTLTAAALAGRNPYVVRDEIGADRLARVMSDADGRGVTIGIVEGVPNFAHPALQSALTLAGDTVAKIAGLLDVSDRVSSERIDTVSSTDGTGTVGAMVVHLPMPGTWYIGSWLRRAGSNGSDTVRYLVAWRDTSEAWVDVDRDGDFQRHVAVPNINERFGLGLLPVDSAHHAFWPLAFAIAFNARGTPHVYARGIGGQHTTMVSGTSAGSHFLGGQTGGVAPSARLLFATQGLEGFIAAARDPRVDVLSNQLGGARFPASGGSVSGIVLDRLVAFYRKPIFVGANNAGPGYGTVGALASASGVIAVGAYVSARTYRVNQDWHVPDADNLALYSSRGPGDDGAMKPDVVAPSHIVTSGACADEPRGGEPHRTYALPECYTVGNGTSNATPFAAGAAALLISAARQARLPAHAYDGPAIMWALRASARPIAGVSVADQGAGLIQVDSAWTLLRRVAASRVTIVASAPVENAYAPYLTEPGRGPGLLLANGWRVGQRGSRQIMLERTDGPATPTSYRLRWRGNDGTFSLVRGRVILPVRVPTAVTVGIAPRHLGLHGAALEVIDPIAQVVLARVPATVMVGMPLTAPNHFSAQRTETVKWPRTKTTFVTVPGGADQLRVVVRGHRGDALLSIRGPLAGQDAEGEAAVLPGQEVVVTVGRPASGVWSVVVQPRDGDTGSEPVGAGRTLSYTVTATAVRARAVIDSAVDGGRSVTFTNAWGAIRQASISGAIGARRVIDGAIPASAEDTLMPLAPIDVAVERGTTSLRVSLVVDGDSGTVGHRADLYLYRCVDAHHCTRIGDEVSRDGGRQGRIVPQPAVGLWRIVVDPVSVRRLPLRYRVEVVATNPAFGSVRVGASDSSAHDLESGAAWRVPVMVDIDSAVRGRSDLVGVVDLLSGQAPATTAFFPSTD